MGECLVVQVLCGRCDGAGMVGDDDCAACGAMGVAWRNAAATDLLTDPRVRALVEALRGEVASLMVRRLMVGGRGPSDASIVALAPFERAP